MSTDITLDELLENINRAKARMSRRNPHRLLFRQCQDALIQIAQRASSSTDVKRETANVKLGESR